MHSRVHAHTCMHAHRYGECVLPTTIQGVKNGGQDCFNQCNKTEGPCEFCGTSSTRIMLDSAVHRSRMIPNHRHIEVLPQELGNELFGSQVRDG